VSEAKRKIVREEARLQAMAQAVYDKLPEETRKKLEHNIQILKALEAEHAKEQEEKAKLNANLEGQGAESLDQKLSLLTKTANAVGSVGGEAEYSFKVNEPVSEEIPEQA
jgi:TRAP-type C4-dicarboxylate transport system substrate-binding protein